MIEVKVENLIKHFGNVRAIDNISFTVEPGEIFFLLGPSGCGKTTLLRTLAGFYTPDSGRILFGDHDVTKLPPHKRKTGMVFQSYALWPHMTVAENVAFGLHQMKGLSRNEIKERVADALESVHMAAYGDRKPAQLSGGQQQRVALARALVIRPRCLLMDEPLSNLDAQLRYYMRLEIQRICKEHGLTTIYVTHDQKEALSIADRMAVLSSGHIQQVGSAQDVYKRPQTRFVANFIGVTNIIEGKIDGKDGDCFVIDTAFGKFKGITAAKGKSLKAGDKVSLSIRPECFTLNSKSKDVNVLKGSIGRATYYGEVAHYRFLKGDLKLKMSELNPSHLDETERENLYASVKPEDVVILED